MSLREEIFTFLKKDWLSQIDPMDYRLSMQTEIILKLIEKRIDSTIPNQSTTTGYLWAIGFNDALRQVKEMLK